MEWVRIHSLIQNWPGGGPPPVFDISADENGSVVVELAWDPQALMAPGTYTDPLRYYSSDIAFNATVTADNGSTRSISVPAQTIQLTNNRATWSMPQALWDGYMEETFKTLRTPPTTTFSRNIYYRVRATAAGASQARIWPSDSVLRGPNASAAVHIGILPISATPSSQVVPDNAAVRAMGGPVLLPTLWGDILTLMWRHLPENNPNRQALVRIFAHQAFTGADLPTKAAILKLWLFAGPRARPRLPQLLDRRAVVGSNLTMPVISKIALRGGKTLAENLLALLNITPHPDLTGVVTKEQLLDDVITEILDPNGQINQGAAGTCSPTSLQTLLITINPSEYARLQLGWLSASGRAILANGGVADVPVGILKIANYANVAGQPFLMRTYSELAFQAAILKYAQGNSFPAFAGTPQSMNQIFQATVAGGLTSDQTKRALDAAFNVNFTTHYISLPADSSNAAWVSAQRAIRDGLVRDLPVHQQQMLVAMFWSQPYNFGHMVLGLRREPGSSRLFFKNPQYPGSHPAPGIAQGGAANNPPRRYEDPTQALESIAEADLASWIKGYWVPDTAII